MAKNTHHVVPDPEGGWAVRRGGASRSSGRFGTRREAETWGRRLSMRQGTELVIHKRDGTVERVDTRGLQPRP
jgi:hypothetical protein